jgi:hypothetical protein
MKKGGREEGGRIEKNEQRAFSLFQTQAAAYYMPIGVTT